MRIITKNLLLPILLLSSSAVVAVAPYYSIRSQAENAARDLAGAGWATQIHCCNDTQMYGNLSVAAEYTRSFHPYYIGKTLFGCCGNNCYYQNNCCGSSNTCANSCCADECTTIRISGSGVADRGSCDWLADYFGLPTDYKSNVKFEPRIQNAIVDFNLFVGLECCPGLYFRLGLPVVHTRWDLNMCECVENPGSENHWAGYFNKTIQTVTEGSSTLYYGILRNNLASNFTSFISGCETINSNDMVFNKLNFARMCPCEQKETALADVNAMLGWDFWCCDDYHFGVNVRASAPAGNRPEARYLFEPIVGNGKHWAVGAGLSGHWTFWKECNECNYWGFYIDANFTHLFKARQCRTFDLRCKPLSRYMLAGYYSRPVENLAAEANDGPTPIKQFKDVYAPVANLTTFPVDVSVDLQSDVALKFQHVRGNWGFDVGYNFWSRSCENIEFACGCQCPFEENAWALKGDAFMYGLELGESTVIALSATQSKATICKGTNNRPDGDITNSISWVGNPGIDYRQEAYARGGNALIDFNPSHSIVSATRTSLQPQFISYCDIDCDAARTRAFSNKIFGSVDYTWRDRDGCECWVPWLGLGFEVEIGHHLFDDGCDACCQPCSGNEYACGTGCCYPCDKCCNDNCCCQYIPLSQWGVWLKGGVAF